MRKVAIQAWPPLYWNAKGNFRSINAMGFTRACIYNWLAMYRAGGWNGLDARKRGGRARKLNGCIIRWVYQVVIRKDPRPYKFPYALWTRKAIATSIYQRYDTKTKNMVY